jgi:hypothetical protein
LNRTERITFNVERLRVKGKIALLYEELRAAAKAKDEKGENYRRKVKG